MYKTYTPFEKYIERIQDHCKYNDDFYDIIPLLEKRKEYYDNYNTFCHGDFSLENLIQTDKGLYLIDPIWNENNWSSYLLDISKMLHSYRKYNRMFEYEVFLTYYTKNNGESLDENALKILEVTQFIRVLKYIKNPKLKEEIYSLTKNLLEECLQRLKSSRNKVLR